MFASKIVAALSLCGTAFSLSGYSVDIPESAVVVNDLATLRSVAADFPNSTLQTKYGGNVIEVDDEIVVATEENLGRGLQAMLSSLSAPAAQESDANVLSKRQGSCGASCLDQAACIGECNLCSNGPPVPGQFGTCF